MRATSDSLESKSSAETQVSVVATDPTEISLYTKNGFAGSILEDAGLSRPPSQDLDPKSAIALGSNPVNYNISKEVLDKVDGDAIFLIVRYWDSQIEDTLSSLKTDPLWLKLNAVKQDKVYEVSAYHWTSSGPIAANAILDDLFKYLVEKDDNKTNL